MARILFEANIAGATIENFENQPIGVISGSSFLVTDGNDSIKLTGSVQIKQVDSGTHDGTFPISGNKFAFQFGNPKFELAFQRPRTALGFFATDAGDGGAKLMVLITYSDSSSENFTVPNSTTNTAHFSDSSISGSAIFRGIVSPDKAIRSAEFFNTNSQLDGFGFDGLYLADANLISTSIISKRTARKPAKAIHGGAPSFSSGLHLAEGNIKFTDKILYQVNGKKRISKKNQPVLRPSA